MSVTLMNMFSVPKGKKDEFVKLWEAVEIDIAKLPGYIRGNFHRGLKPDSRFNIINVALWENEAGYWKAYEKSAAPMKTELQQMGVEMTPAFFNVIFEY